MIIINVKSGQTRWNYKDYELIGNFIYIEYIFEGERVLFMTHDGDGVNESIMIDLEQAGIGEGEYEMHYFEADKEFIPGKGEEDAPWWF